MTSGRRKRGSGLRWEEEDVVPCVHAELRGELKKARVSGMEEYGGSHEKGVVQEGKGT